MIFISEIKSYTKTLEYIVNTIQFTTINILLAIQLRRNKFNRVLLYVTNYVDDNNVKKHTNNTW